MQTRAGAPSNFLNPNQCTRAMPAHPARAVSRRSLLMNIAVVSPASATIVASSSALAVAAFAPARNAAAPCISDSKLRELWAQYLEHAAAEREAHAAFKAAAAAFEAEMPPCPPDVSPGIHFRAHRWLQNKTGRACTYKAWGEAADRLVQTIEDIHKEDAEGLFGVGVKLAGQTFGGIRNSDIDAENAIESALADIDRLLGTDFLAALPDDWAEWPNEDEEDES
jgi:hypothetical protein